MSTLAIDLKRVAKTYGRRTHALRDVSLQVHRGEVFGLLGPNGAGKSTLVKILMTVISPTRCEGQLLGERVGHKQTLTRVGYLPEHHKFPDYLTGVQVLDFFAAMSGVDRRTRKARAASLLDTVGLSAWADKRVKQYSKGMRQRLGIAQSLINDPDLILLDEPTDGVDPVGRRDIRELILNERRRGRTVFLNSHLLSELEMVCDRAAIMVQGRVWTQGTLADLTAYGKCYELEIGPGAPGVTPDPSSVDPARPATWPSVIVAARVLGAIEPRMKPSDAAAGPVASGVRLPDGRTLEFETAVIRLVGEEDPARVQPFIDAARSAGFTIRTCRSVRPSLEDLFMLAVTDPTTGQALPPGAASQNNGVSSGLSAPPPAPERPRIEAPPTVAESARSQA